jgi:hypothetical protein
LRRAGNTAIVPATVPIAGRREFDAFANRFAGAR